MIHLLWASLLIPIAIHLVHRRKAKHVLFSTLRFLRMVDQRVARRQKLKELLLLALRLLLLAALIGALYRPMLRSATFQGGDVSTAAGIVLDNTYSMRATDQGVMRFGRARKVAREIVDGLRKGDCAVLALLDPGDATRPAATTDLGGLREQLANVECGYGTAELAPALQRVLQSLDDTGCPRREIYVITDFQRLSWTNALSDVGARLGDDVPVFLIDVGGEIGDNLALDSAAFGLNVQVVGAEADVYCDLTNGGRRSATKELSFVVEGHKVDEQTVTLAAGGQLSANLSHTLDRTGESWGAARLSSDGLAADNERYFTFTVHEKLPVLLVNGDPSTVPYADETFYLEMALRAPAAGGDAVSPVEPHVVTADAFLDRKLDDYCCVVWANVPRLDEMSAEALRRYLTAGGGLIVFLGDRVDAASYNAMLAGGEELLLPAPLGEMRQAAGADGREAFRVRQVAEQHPLFRGLAGGIDLGAARVERFFTADIQSGQDAALLAGLDAGPLLVERKIGPGTVILCTTSADLDWSNLPAKGAFLPLVHQMVYYVGRSGSSGDDVPVGMPYALDLPRSREPMEVAVYAVEPRDEQNDDEPLGTVIAEPAGGGQRAVISDTHRPGVYRVEYVLDGERRSRLFAVNVETRESVADRIEPHEAVEMLGAASVTVLDKPDEAARVALRERTGLPLWNYLFFLALALAVVEGYVGNVLLKH